MALKEIAVDREFIEHFDVKRSEVTSGKIKIVKTGSGEAFPVESKYLQPVIHTLMHIDQFVVTGAHCSNLALIVGSPRSKLTGTHVDRYLQWGEDNGIQNGTTIKARASAGHPWYDLASTRREKVLWAKSHQYRHCAPMNPEQFLANCNLYTVDAPEDPFLVAGVLNSSLVLLAKQLYGRPVGVEGNLKTEVVDVKIMPVPNWKVASQKVQARVIRAMKKLAARPIMGVLSEQRLRRKSLLEDGKIDEIQNYSDRTEFDEADRRELDDAVLEVLGVADAAQRTKLRGRLYQYLEEYFEAIRRKEERGIDNKARTKKSSKITPQKVAADVFGQIEQERPVLLRGYRDLVKIPDGEPSDGVRVPTQGVPHVVDDMLNVGVSFMLNKKKGQLIKTRSRAQADLVVRIFELGETGRHHFVPVNETMISQAINAIEQQIKKRATDVRALIAERTQDPELLDRAYTLVMAKF